jgi:cellulose synthase/poly-beta-1,6-N-acetylglucosamine synthase-like glycosyltransferase
MDILIIIESLFLLASFFYFLVNSGLIIGIKRAHHGKGNCRPFISIIVAARNEEKNIQRLIECLLRQSYPLFEIIIINDRSTDSTASIINEYQKKNTNLRKIDISSISDDMPAKKNALRAGIEKSKGEILCFTDADCIPPPDWINELVNEFDPEVGLVAGYSPYQIPGSIDSDGTFLKKTFFNFIAYEEFRAAIWSAGSIGLNLGWLCTGRNLAYRRAVYDEIGGYERIKMSISGDDDLFLQLVRRQTDWNIRYLTSARSFVPTLPASDINTFLEQRKRHFSAAKFFTFPMMLFFFAYHFSNLLMYFSLFMLIIDFRLLPYMLICLAVKMTGDTILFRSSCFIFKSDRFNRSYIFMEALYFFYNSIVGPLGIFRKFGWK